MQKKTLVVRDSERIRYGSYGMFIFWVFRVYRFRIQGYSSVQNCGGECYESMFVFTEVW